MGAQNEELLAAWLQVSGVINNQRLVKGLPYNEALVCNLLVQAEREGRRLTAKELCDKTNILKSQMNAILLSLEKQSYILRQPSQRDRRQMEIQILPEGIACYQAAHRGILELVDRFIDTMGEDKVSQLIPLLRQSVETFTMIQQEA